MRINESHVFMWALDMPPRESETETEMKCTKMSPYVPAAKMTRDSLTSMHPQTTTNFAKIMQQRNNTVTTVTYLAERPLQRKKEDGGNRKKDSRRKQ